MKIKVRSFAFIRETLGAKQVQIEVEEGASVEKAVLTLVQENEDLKNHLLNGDRIKKDFVFALNGNQIPYEELSRTLLEEGDTVVILPPAGGG